ncbi:hypothetical protein K1719_028021 [Acacia pycnantha]|nr:hypothetical protein K1719_028021 [Acacia pycnantha]
MGLSDYIEALESERSKILVFSKDLPLSLDLVTHSIEACRLQLRGRRRTFPEQNLKSGQSWDLEGPVLEEFIPIKMKRISKDDEEEDEQHSQKPKIFKHHKSDWLRSVQLWNNNPQSTLNEDIPGRKTSVLEVIKGDGGAFQPFHREATSVGKTTTGSTANKASSSPAPAPPPAAGSNKKEGHNNNNKRKQRRCWSQELHKRFLNAIHQLGGADSATPKQIRELVKFDGLTNDEVKSHLQKFRLHTRRSSPLIQNNGDLQMAPFVLVGNFIVQQPPPGHAAAVATWKASSEKVMTTISMQLPGIYAPVASHATGMERAAVPAKGKERKLDWENCCWGRSNSEDSEMVADHSNSPSSSYIFEDNIPKTQNIK